VLVSSTTLTPAASSAPERRPDAGRTL